MAEKILWLAKCKLNGMNQRVGMVYDDVTLAVISLRSEGKGAGVLNIKVKAGEELIDRTERLAHKADGFEMVNLRGRATMIKGDTGLEPPFGVAVRWSWQ